MKVFNNKLGSRNIHHMNLLVAQVEGQSLIFPFEGKSIPGVIQVVSTRSEKNGKWSFTEWSVELSEGIESFVWTEDWNEGVYVTAGTWSRAIEDVRKISGVAELCPAAIKRFVRARLPNTAKRLDRAAEAAKADPTPILADLLSAQYELAAANTALKDAEGERVQMLREIQQTLDMRAKAEKARKEAAETAERVTKAKSAMAKGASLADLKALLEAGP